MAVRMGSLVIDGKTYEARVEGRNLLEVCLSLGLDLPYFCWHPAMHSVGACRQCAVKLFRDEKDAKGRIVMACMTQAVDGMRISIQDPEAREFRAGVIEWLMVNHPHDCPVCDEGGECHLQDMTVMGGHVYRGYRFTKRTYKNENLGPFLTHEMNRCIQCYRCARFYRDYAGGRDFAVQGWHDHVYFGRHSDGPLENQFSGNLAEVCPTGVFTDKTLKKHYSRKWDLRTAPSVCAHCGVGCNTSPGERYGMLRRVQPRYNGEVNGYFLCDRGRFGYEFVNGEERIRAASIKINGARAAVTVEQAVQKTAEILHAGPAIGIGSQRASLETNFALRRLVGPENFFIAVPDSQFSLLRLMAEIVRKSSARIASVREAGESDAVLVLGEDVWNTAPILALGLRQASRNFPILKAMREKKIPRWDDAALRHAVQEEKGPFFVLSAEPTELDDCAERVLRASPQDIARIGFAIAREIDPSSPGVSGLSADEGKAAARMARALMEAERPLVVAGSGLGSAGEIMAAANIVHALKSKGKDARLSLVFPEANSLGAALMAQGGLQAAEKAFCEKGARSLFIAEADIFRFAPSADCARLLGSAADVVFMDCVSTPAAENAGVILPSSSFAESCGTFVSSEGRAQRFFSVFPPTPPVMDGWRWLAKISEAAERPAGEWRTLDEVISTLAAELPFFQGIRDAAPNADFRLRGSKIPRDPHRVSGRTSMHAHIGVREPKPPDDPDSPLAFTMEGSLTQPPSPLIPRAWSPGWNSDQAVHKLQEEVGGRLHGGDPGVRLLDGDGAVESGGFEYYPEIPDAFTPSENTILLVPRFHTFGSEELSMISPAVASRAPEPYIALNAEDAARMGVKAGDKARILGKDGAPAPDVRVSLSVVIRGLPLGVGSVPVGAPELSGIPLPARVRVIPGEARK